MARTKPKPTPPKRLQAVHHALDSLVSAIRFDAAPQEVGAALGELDTVLWPRDRTGRVTERMRNPWAHHTVPIAESDAARQCALLLAVAELCETPGPWPFDVARELIERAKNIQGEVAWGLSRSAWGPPHDETVYPTEGSKLEIAHACGGSRAHHPGKGWRRFPDHPTAGDLLPALDETALERTLSPLERRIVDAAWEAGGFGLRVTRRELAILCGSTAKAVKTARTRIREKVEGMADIVFDRKSWLSVRPELSADLRRLIRPMSADEYTDRVAGYDASRYRKRAKGLCAFMAPANEPDCWCSEPEYSELDLAGKEAA